MGSCPTISRSGWFRLTSLCYLLIWSPPPCYCRFKKGRLSVNMHTNRTPHAAICIIVLVVALSLFGCGLGKHPGLTFDEITLHIKAVGHEGDIDSNQWLKVCEVLTRHGMIDCAHYERSNCQQVGAIRVCDFDSITLPFDPPLTLSGLKSCLLYTSPSPRD